jgi:hypothetical protein
MIPAIYVKTLAVTTVSVGDAPPSAPTTSACQISISLVQRPFIQDVVDSGAQVNVMSSVYFETIESKTVKLVPQGKEELRTVNGQKLPVREVAYLSARVANTVLQPSVRFFVVDDLVESLAASVLLGLEFVQRRIHSINWTDSKFS